MVSQKVRPAPDAWNPWNQLILLIRCHTFPSCVFLTYGFKQRPGEFRVGRNPPSQVKHPLPFLLPPTSDPDLSSSFLFQGICYVSVSCRQPRSGSNPTGSELGYSYKLQFQAQTQNSLFQFKTRYTGWAHCSVCFPSPWEPGLKLPSELSPLWVLCFILQITSLWRWKTLLLL